MLKHTLLQQAEIEQKRRRLKQLKADFDIKTPFIKQVNNLLPNITFKDKQVQYINARQFLKYYLGGYKSGKSFTSCAIDIWLAYINRPYPGILVHPTFDGIKLTIKPLLEEICELNKIDLRYKELATKSIALLNFGDRVGQIILASGDVPKSLKGPKLAFGHIDEPFIMKEEIVGVVESRIAEAKAVYSMLQYSGTPEPEHMQWGFDIVDEEYENSDKRFIITVSTTEVAEHLRPGYVEDIVKNNSPEYVETFIHGKYRNLSQGKVYSSFDSIRNMWNPETRQPMREIDLPGHDKSGCEYSLSYDFNVNQMSATLKEIDGRFITSVEEYRIKARSDTEELTRMIISKMKTEGYLVESATADAKSANPEYVTKYGKSLIITGDAAGASGSTKSKWTDYQIIQREFLAAKVKIYMVVMKDNPSVRDRVVKINNLYSAGWLWISTKCKELKRDRELASWKLGADGFSIDKKKKEITHLSDADDYGIIWTEPIWSNPEDRMGVEMFTRDTRGSMGAGITGPSGFGGRGHMY